MWWEHPKVCLGWRLNQVQHYRYQYYYYYYHKNTTITANYKIKAHLEIWQMDLKQQQHTLFYICVLSHCYCIQVCVFLSLKLNQLSTSVILVNKCLRGLAPPYLAELCRPIVHLTGRRHLRSAASGKLDVQRTATAIGRTNFASFRSGDLEQFTSWTASVDTVHGHLCTTPESASLHQHWMTCACSTSDFT